MKNDKEQAFENKNCIEYLKSIIKTIDGVDLAPEREGFIEVKDIYVCKDIYFVVRTDYNGDCVLAFSPSLEEARIWKYTTSVSVKTKSDLIRILKNIESIKIPKDNNATVQSLVKKSIKYLKDAGFKEDIINGKVIYRMNKQFVFINLENTELGMSYRIHQGDMTLIEYFITSFLALLYLPEDMIMDMLKKTIIKYFYVFMNSIQQINILMNESDIISVLGKEQPYDIDQFETYVSKRFDAKKITIEEANNRYLEREKLAFYRKYPEDNGYVHVYEWKDAEYPHGIEVLSDGAHMYTEHFNSIYAIDETVLYRYGLAKYAIEGRRVIVITSSIDGKYLSNIQVISSDSSYEAISFLKKHFVYG